MKFISFGKLNRYYLYILLFVVFLILNNFLLGENYYNLFSERKFFTSEIQKVFNTHYFVHEIIFHFNSILLAYFQIFIIKKCFSRKVNEGISSKNKIELIYIDAEEEIKAGISTEFYFLTIFTMIIEDQLLEKILGYIFSNVDFWMIELIIVSYISSKVFNFKIYKHQKFAIYINAIFPLILKIITIIHNKVHKNFLVVFEIIIYINFIIFRSVVNTKIKFYIDIKYISIEKILILYGIIGTIIFLVYSLITTFISNKIYNYTPEIDFCKSFSNKNIFFENIIQYFKIFSECKDWKNVEYFYELGYIIIGSILLYGKKYCYLSIIKHFTPTHVIFSYPLFYMLDKLILMIYTLIGKQRPFEIMDSIKIEKFYLDISGDLISILCYMIYLEIIIFHCYKLDYNSKENIIERGINDIKITDSTNLDESRNGDDTIDDIDNNL